MGLGLSGWMSWSKASVSCIVSERARIVGWLIKFRVVLYLGILRLEGLGYDMTLVVALYSGILM